MTDLIPERLDGEAGPLLDVWAKIGVRLESLTGELRAERDERARLWESVRFIPVNPAQFAFGSLPAVLTVTPKHGYTWAVQRVSVAGIGVSPDVVSLYRGASPADAVAQNFLNTLSAAVPAWHPGGKGCLLKPSQTIVVGGGTTGNTYTVNIDVIQVADEWLPRYLT